MKLEINITHQSLEVIADNTEVIKKYTVSTAKNGVGELNGSEQTPRGKHIVAEMFGKNHPQMAVFVARKWTTEIYNSKLAQLHPDRDWILTRIISLAGVEKGFNKGGNVDSWQRYIYIHGTPYLVGTPLSKGCIRMNNNDIMELFEIVVPNMNVEIIT